MPLQPFAPTVLMTADLGLSEHAVLLGTSEYMNKKRGEGVSRKSMLVT